MVEKILLASSALLISVLALRSLRRMGGTSLLAWQVLVFVLTFTPAAFFLEEINDNSLLSVAATDPLVVSRFINCLLLANIVIIGCLLFLGRLRVDSKYPDEDRTDLYEDTPLAYWIGMVVVVIGIVVFVTSERVQTVLDQGVLGLGDYNTYYDIRFAISQITSSTLEQYLYVIPLGIILPLLTLYSLYRFILTHRKIWLIRWGGLALTWLILSILYYAKQPILAVILSNVMLLVLTNRFQQRGSRRRFSWKWLIIGGSGLLLAVFLIYRTFGATEDFLTSIQFLAERFVVIPVLTMYNHLYVFPELNPHTYYQGSTILNLALAGGQSSLGGQLPAYYITSEILTGHAFNMNTGFVGAGWAAMGYVGVVQGAVLIFGAFTLWDAFFLNGKRYNALTILVAYFVGRIDNIQNIDLLSMLVQGGILLAPLFLIFLIRRERHKHLDLLMAIYPMQVIGTRKDHA